MQKNISLGQLLEIIASVGVIAGIVFLAVELQQNNELLGAEARSTRLSVRLEEAQLPIHNPGLAEALIKHRHGEELTEYEQLVLARYMETLLVIFQNVFTEAQRGLIDENSIPLESWRGSFSGRNLSVPGYWPNVSAYWEASKSDFDPAFVEFVENNLIDR